LTSSNIGGLSEEIWQVIGVELIVLLSDKELKHLDDDTKMLILFNTSIQKIVKTVIEDFVKDYKRLDKKFEKQLEGRLKKFFRYFLPKGFDIKTVKVRGQSIYLRFKIHPSAYQWLSLEDADEDDIARLPKDVVDALPGDQMKYVPQDKVELSDTAKAKKILGLDPDDIDVDKLDLPEGWEVIIIGDRDDDDSRSDDDSGSKKDSRSDDDSGSKKDSRSDDDSGSKKDSRSDARSDDERGGQRVQFKLTPQAFDALSVDFIVSLTAEQFSLFDSSIMAFLTAAHLEKLAESGIFSELDEAYLLQLPGDVLQQLKPETLTLFVVNFDLKTFEQKYHKKNHKKHGHHYAKYLKSFYKNYYKMILPRGWRVKIRVRRDGVVLVRFKPPKYALRFVTVNFTPLIDFGPKTGELPDDIEEEEEIVTEGADEEEATAVEILQEIPEESLPGLQEEQIESVSDEELAQLPESVKINVFVNVKVENKTTIARFMPKDIKALPPEILQDEKVVVSLIENSETLTPELEEVIKQQPLGTRIQVSINLSLKVGNQDKIARIAPPGWQIDPNTSQIELTEEAASEGQLTPEIMGGFGAEQIVQFHPRSWRHFKKTQIASLSP